MLKIDFETETLSRLSMAAKVGNFPPAAKILLSALYICRNVYTVRQKQAVLLDILEVPTVANDEPDELCQLEYAWLTRLRAL